MTVIDLNKERAKRRRAGIRLQLIRSFKNPAMRMTPAELQELRLATAQALREHPHDDGLRVKWELLQEVLYG